VWRHKVASGLDTASCSPFWYILTQAKVSMRQEWLGHRRDEYMWLHLVEVRGCLLAMTIFGAALEAPWKGGGWGGPSIQRDYQASYCCKRQCVCTRHGIQVQAEV